MEPLAGVPWPLEALPPLITESWLVDITGSRFLWVWSEFGALLFQFNNRQKPQKKQFSVKKQERHKKNVKNKNM